MELMPVTSLSELPVSSYSEAQRVWTGRQVVPTDTLRAHLSRLQKASECFQALPESELERPSMEVLYSLKWQGYLHAALSQFSSAFDVFDDALGHLEEGPLGPDTGDTSRASERSELYQDRGYLHYLLGDLPKAIDQYVRALRSTPTEETAQRIDRLQDIGVLYQRIQDYRSARFYLGQARHVYQENNLSNSTLRANILHSQADLLLEQALNTQFNAEALERARVLARRGRAAAEAGTEQHARISLLLSESLGYLGEPGMAFRLNDEAGEYVRRHDRVRLEALVLLKRGLLYMQTERWSQAKTSLDQSLSLAEELGDLDYQRRILRDLGRLHEMQRQWAEAEQYYREGAAAVEKYRASLTASQWSMTAFSQWRDVHRGLVRSLLAQGRTRDAFSVLDRSRARHLHDLRTQSEIVSQQSRPVQAQFDSLTQALSDVRTRLGTDTLSPSAEADLRSKEASLISARHDLVDVPPSVDRPPLDSLPKTAYQEDRALVSYFIDDPWPIYDRPPRSAAFVLDGDSLRTIPLPNATQDSLQSLINDVSSLFDAPEASPSAEHMHFDLRPLHRLQETVYAPIADHLSRGRALTVVPDGPLRHVPFSALVRDMPGGRYAPDEARYVLHERPVSMQLGASIRSDATFPSRPESSSSETGLAAFGMSDFDAFEAATSPLRPLLSDANPERPGSLTTLPGVKSELDVVRQLFGDESVSLNENATESSFRSACRRGGVIHLASHAFVHPSSPLHNAFLLHPDSSTSSDGVLFLHELPRIDNPIPLVVLSGCNTARGTLRSGEGMAGLQYGFRAMGARATVSNLWPAADRTAQALMEDFYRMLQDGQPKDEALRQAKLAYLEQNPDQASPFFWAPTVLYGSPEPVDLPSRSVIAAWRTWILGGVGLLLIAGLLVWIRQRSRS